MYHGTSSDRAQNIMDKGLKGSRTSVTKTPGVVNTQGSLLKRDAFVTDDPKIADSYAKEKAVMDGGKPSVVAIKVPKKNLKKGANPAGCGSTVNQLSQPTCCPLDSGIAT